MADKTIDLRKNSGPRLAANLGPRGNAVSGPHGGADSNANEPFGAPERGKELLGWDAPEYRKVNHSPNWWLWPGAGALALVIIGILAKSYFFIAVVALAFIVLLLYARREPHTLRFAIHENGVRAGRNFYPFGELKTFWVFEREGERELSLETTKTLSPFMRLPMGKTPPEKARDLLSRVLEEEEHREFLSDQIAKKI